MVFMIFGVQEYSNDVTVMTGIIYDLNIQYGRQFQLRKVYFSQNRRRNSIFGSNKSYVRVVDDKRTFDGHKMTVDYYSSLMCVLKQIRT